MIPVGARPIPGFVGYLVDPDGNVYSTRKARSGRRLRTSPHTFGYPLVNLYREGRMVSKAVHALVLLAFMGPPPEGQETRHLDSDPRNCALSNLRYGTRAENAADRERNGTAPRGEKNPRAKLTVADVVDIRAMSAMHISYKRIASTFGVSVSHVWRILSGQCWATADVVEAFGPGDTAS